MKDRIAGKIKIDKNLVTDLKYQETIKEKPWLPSVTLVAVSGNKYGETLNALYKSKRECDFARVLYITDTDLKADGIDVVKVAPIKSWQRYNEFIVKELYKHITTDYIILIQHDGFVINGGCFDESFYNFDYIGARWLYEDGRSVGNGGCSWRSKRMLEITAKDETIEICTPEDESLCRLYRTHLETVHGIKYADERTADKFSYELHEPTQKTMCFHGYHWPQFKEHVVIKRSYAMGDVILCEPLIDYYSKKGYQVVLDIPSNLMSLFMQSPYSLKHISQLKGEITPIKYIDLDGAYEKKPKQLVLKSYYEAAGIEDGEIRNPRLYFPIDERNKLFKKYAVVHIDETGMPHRNIRGVHWKGIVQYLNARGYEVFQIGKGKHEDCGIFFNAGNEPMMMYLLAGADLFIGIDSGPSHIAVALGVPSVIMFGSVNAAYRHANMEKIRVVQNKCKYHHCYHEVVSEVGQDCQIDKELPPCTDFSATQIMEQINELI